MGSTNFKQTAYHGTCSLHKASITQNGLDPNKTTYRDDHWLGQGVYYFEDYNQAKWWAKSISSKKESKESYALIYESEIEADENQVLDLDDNNQLSLFLKFARELTDSIEKDDNGSMPVFTTDKMRAVYFDYYNEKQICVSKKECIKTVDIVYNEEEVI